MFKSKVLLRRWTSFHCVISVLIIITECFTLALHGQDLRFEHLTKDIGLTESGYNSFVKRDSRGFIWISSLDGLNRFDGQNIRTYRAHHGKQGRLLGDRIQSSFFEDKDGNLWFTTKEALNCYVRSQDTIRSIQLEGYDNSYHLFHLEKSHSRLWLAIENKICLFDAKTSSFKDLEIITSGRRFAVDTLDNGTVNKIYACSWIEEPGIEVISWNKDVLDWKSVKYLKDSTSMLGKLAPFISQALPFNDSITWLCSDVGLILFDDRNPSENRVFCPPDHQHMNVRNICKITDEQLLLSSYQEGLWLFDTERLEFTKNWRASSEEVYSPASNAPKELYHDDLGHVWVTHYQKGLDLSVGQFNTFRDPLKNLGLTNPSAEFIVEDQVGNIWVATKKQGIFVFSKDEDLLQRHIYESGEIGSLAIDELKHLSVDQAGNVWCLGRQAIFRYDPKVKQWNQVLACPDQELFFLMFLRSGRKLLTTNEGIFNLRETDGSYVLTPAKDIENNDQFNFFHLLESKAGKVYLPSKLKDLLVYEQDDVFSLKLSSKKVLGGEVYGMVELSGKDTLWLGTSNGLALLNQHSGNLKMLLQEDWQIGTRDVYMIIHDEACQRLWISSNDGLWKYNLKSKQLSRFTEIDGITSREFTNLAGLHASDGKIWFGNHKGLTVFHPDSIGTYPYPPKPYLNGLLVNNTPYKGESVIGESETIELKYQDNNLAFELLAIGVHNPEKNKLRYRLKNYDDSWTIIKNGDYARFTKIPPGGYVLETAAINANGLESPIKRLEIQIKPPFWQTAWFRTISVIASIFIIWTLHRIYIQKKLQAQRIVFERRQAQMLERERIRKDLHDDLGAGLSTIQFQSEDLLLQKSNFNLLGSIRDIRDTAINLMESMDEIVWALNPENDTIENLILNLRKYSQSFLSKYGFTPELNIQEVIPTKEVKGEIRRNIKLILKEMLHNIVKHSKAAQVRVDIVLNGAILFILAKDDGIGISEPKPDSRQGNGLRNMHQRAAAVGGKLEIKSAPDQGTEITLQVPMSLS